MRKLLSVFKNESGATAIEYGLIAALISIAAIAAMNSLVGALDNTFNTVSANMAGAGR